MGKIKPSGYPANDGKKWVDLLSHKVFLFLTPIKKHKLFEKNVARIEESFDELRVAYIKELVYRWNAEHKIESLIKRLNKFSGKKVSKENEDIYKEIEDTYKILNEDGLEVSYTNATKKIARKHRKQFKSLYPAFMKWKNRHYAKSK
jgi:hypothetical protein